MNIKSNSKKPSKVTSFFKSTWSLIKDIVSGLGTSKYFVFFLIMTISSYFAWDYSGMLSVWLALMAIIIPMQRDTWEPMADHILLIIISSLVFIILSSMNVFDKENQIINVEYSKIEFTDSTERMVVYMSKPVKRVEVVADWTSSDYYTAKSNKDSIKIWITETASFDHIDKVANDNHIEEYNYRLDITYDGGAYDNKMWITDEKLHFPDANRTVEKKS